ncbi:hypothetical protein C7964_103813 [Loktanella sp. PT4BL]|jgi:hypothetical protein|uniref:DUF6626 family protein n=1 Tax=Loktanella sp. PT4BL TaxID=2135611 RepID=UPI000D8EC6E4|nr:DUF6626 family protein [Loktanella sp. PT4BL]PXW69293.1 hypothetical protein C7964_103813 [Loktanella sp. PT4BL]
MSVKLLEHLRDELLACGAAQNTPEFCRAWLGRSEGYIRTLRNHGTGPSVETLAICSHKLGHYADRLRSSGDREHGRLAEQFDRLKLLCDQAIAEHAEAVWRAPERMSA